MAHPNYYAIIPANVRYDNELVPNEKLMYGELTCLSNKYGYCFATNEYFAKLYGVTERTVQNWLNHLEEKNYLKRVITYEGDRAKRKIYLQDFIDENNFTPETDMGEIEDDIDDTPENNFISPPENNFVYNNINNIILQDKGEEVPQTPSVVPVVKEVVEMTREQANRKIDEAKMYGIKYKITNGMYEFPKQYLKVIDEPPLKEKEKPKDPDAFDFI